MPTPTLETSTQLTDAEVIVAPNDEIGFTAEQAHCMRTVDDLLEQLERKYTSIG